MSILFNSLNSVRAGVLIKKGVGASIDQGLVSITALILNVLLIRWVDAESFGSFVVVYTVLQVVIAIHNAFFSEPMLIYGTKKFPNKLREYTGLLLFGQIILGVFLLILGGILFLVSDTLNNNVFWGAISGAIIGTPFILFFHFIRKTLYLNFKPIYALSGLSYFLFVNISAYIAFRMKILDSFTVFIAMGISSLLVGIIFSFVIKPILDLPHKETSMEIIRLHWVYGRWEAMSSVLRQATNSIFFYLAPFFITLSEIGAYKAIQMLFLPIERFLLAMILVLLPWSAKRSEQKNFTRLMLTISVLFTGAALAYSIAVFLFRVDIVNLLYKGKHVQYLNLVPMFSIWVILSAFSRGAQIGLRAKEKTAYILTPLLFSASLSIICALFFLPNFGVIGGAISKIAGILVLSSGAWWMFYYSQKHGSSSGQGGNFVDPVKVN